MELIGRILQVIVPVFFIVAVGFFYGRRARLILGSGVLGWPVIGPLSLALSL